MRHVTLVTGPPCGGKSTWVERHARPGDVLVCFDHLARRAGSRNTHRHTREQRHAAGAAFRRLCEQLAERDDVRAWVIRCAPTAAERAELADQVRADEVLVLRPPLAVALRRAEAARREPRVAATIRRWYAIHELGPGDRLIEPGAAPAW